MKTFDTMLGKLIKPAAKTRGFAEAQLIKRWSEITPEYNTYTYPAKLWNNTLTIATNSDSVKMNMQMQSIVLIERINGYMGYPIVQSLRFIHKSFVEREEFLQETIKPNASDKNWAEQKCKGVQAGSLREALVKLGAVISAEKIAK